VIIKNNHNHEINKIVLIKNNLGFFVNWKSKQDKKAKKTIGFKEVSILFKRLESLGLYPQNTEGYP
jgi:hypothetical protein